MKNVLIVENSTSSLKGDFGKNDKEYILSGIFTEFGVKNRNERIYTAEKFLPALSELNDRINGTLGVVYGELDHPDVFDTSLSRVSHKLDKVVYNKTQNRVDGQISLLPTHYGKDAMALIDSNCPLFVSSRAAGITDENNGNVTIKKLFTYDIVADPGFANARMNVKPLNESLGFDENKKTNFRIYEISDESKINELFNMNKNEMVTKGQLNDYSKYLAKELQNVNERIVSASRKGNLSKRDFDKLLEYYDALQADNQKMKKYLNYLGEKVQVVVNENESLKTKQNALIRHNDYLAETLQKSIDFSDYLRENINKTINYTEYVAEKVNNNINYSEYIAEKLNKNINFSNYIVEHVNKTIHYSEYLAEHLDKNISYSEYIAEKLNNNINYSEYIAEHVNKNIAYAEYIAEHVDNNIAFTEYVAENTNNNIIYNKYIAEQLDKSIDYQGKIAECINNNNIYESVGGKKVPSLKDAGFEETDDKEDDKKQSNKKVVLRRNTETLDKKNSSLKDKKTAKSKNETFENRRVTLRRNLQKTRETIAKDDLTKKVDDLIESVKNQKIANSNDNNFLKFLNKDQIVAYNNLSAGDKYAIKKHIKENENLYFSENDVLRLMNEALSSKKETMEERLIRMMPESVKSKWECLSVNEKKSIISQAKLYPAENLITEGQVEQFWLSRPFKKDNPQKVLVKRDAILEDNRITNAEYEKILEKINYLND